MIFPAIKPIDLGLPWISQLTMCQRVPSSFAPCTTGSMITAATKEWCVRNKSSMLEKPSSSGAFLQSWARPTSSNLHTSQTNSVPFHSQKFETPPGNHSSILDLAGMGGWGWLSAPVPCVHGYMCINIYIYVCIYIYILYILLYILYIFMYLLLKNVCMYTSWM